MTTNIKRIFLTAIASCMLGASIPTICAKPEAEQKIEQQQKGWSTAAKISLAVAVLGICGWLYCDLYTQRTLATAAIGAQRQFIEDLKYHAAHIADGSVRLITPETSYNKVADAEFLKNTVASLKLLNTDFKSTLFGYQVGSKLCALLAALGIYGFMQPTQEEKKSEQLDTVELV